MIKNLQSYFIFFLVLIGFGCSKEKSLQLNKLSINPVKIANTSVENQFYFNKGSNWKYNDSGTDLGTQWRNENYNDESWQSGITQMGFGDGDESTILKKGHITYYFRKKINISNITAIPDSVNFHIIHDDAAVLYINGTEIFRSSLLPQSGNINYLTGTNTFIPNNLENTFFVYKVPKSAFKNGSNVIAIEIHNQNISSSDLSFDCFVTDENNLPVDGPYVFINNNQYIIKQFDRSKGLIEKTYTNRADVELVIQMPDRKDFKVKLSPSPLTTPPSTYSTPSKYVAISDLEGNVEGMVMLLRGANVIDENYNWTYGNGHLVILGDMFDRGDHVSQILWLIYKLEQESILAGGRVHFILGNHDVMNMINDLRYVHEKYEVNAQQLGVPLKDLYANNTELGRWLRTKNIIEKLGNTLLVHAGISPQVADLNLSFDVMNSYGRDVLNGTCTSTNCKLVTGGSASGLYWYRGMANETLSQTQVNSILNKFNATNVMIGHTVRDNNNNLVEAIYNQKVFTIDLHHEVNTTKNFMSSLIYQNGCYYNFHTSPTQTYKTILVGNCTN